MGSIASFQRVQPAGERLHAEGDDAGHGGDENGALFRPIKNNRTGRLEKPLDLVIDDLHELVRGAYSAVYSMFGLTTVAVFAMIFALLLVAGLVEHFPVEPADHAALRAAGAGFGDAR